MVIIFHFHHEMMQQHSFRVNEPTNNSFASIELGTVRNAPHSHLSLIDDTGK